MCVCVCGTNSLQVALRVKWATSEEPFTCPKVRVAAFHVCVCMCVCVSSRQYDFF